MKTRKIFIAVISAMLALALVIPMLTALIPQRGPKNNDDIYIADGPEDGEGGDYTDTVEPDVRALIEELNSVFYSIRYMNIEEAPEAEAAAKAEELADWGDGTEIDREGIRTAVDEYFSSVGEGEKADFFDRLDMVYKAYLDTGNVVPTVEELKEIIDEYR